MSRWRRQLNRRRRLALLRATEVEAALHFIRRWADEWRADGGRIPFGAWLARNTVIDWSKAVPLS